jgi:hypothetical protein
MEYICKNCSITFDARPDQHRIFHNQDCRNEWNKKNSKFFPILNYILANPKATIKQICGEFKCNSHSLSCYCSEWRNQGYILPDFKQNGIDAYRSALLPGKKSANDQIGGVRGMSGLNTLQINPDRAVKSKEIPSEFRRSVRVSKTTVIVFDSRIKTEQQVLEKYYK